ncbi:MULTISPECIES: acyltransferase family protein [Streptomyces]|uniref:Acyltransferase n=1 Tax=Streptomyces morookaense TaxID=1970 RepID=A0A7Y7B1J2_STRMO|nr:MULTISPECIES: acyltransferase [Streptomyces]MCC2278657.1 acyltransferase [Streptomyces sp. ET3-23]NVK77331.1 acyltransferase [Streptomyces morookaense]GHF18432.1 acyltransferase [Streptomyces morookaense]
MRFANRGEIDGGRPAAPGKTPRLYALDGLRLVAALMVVLYHYTYLTGGWGTRDTRRMFSAIEPITRYGWLGVEVFFLISGFVICMSAWGRSLGDFVVSRASRIYPAYWVAVAVTGTVVMTWPQVRSLAGWETVVTNFSMLQHGLGVWDVDGVYWTLFVELKFYVLFALVVARGVTYRRCVLFCGIWTVAAATAPAVNNKLLDMWAMPLYAPYFIAGIAFYLMHRFKPTALLWGIVVVSYLLANHHVAKRVHDNANHVMALFPAQLGVLAAFAVMSLVALRKFDRVQWPWLATAGALTFPLYLLHQYIGMTVVYGLREKVAPPLLVTGLIAVMLGAAWLMHRYVERPLGKWLRTALLKGMEEVRRNTPERGPRPAAQEPAQEPVAAPRQAYGYAEVPRAAADR